MIRRAGPDDMSDVLEIRRVVFIVGQDVPEDLERDGLDDKAIHVIAFHEGQAIGTARLLIEGDSAKIGRVSVLEELRGKGHGTALMYFVLDELRREAVTVAKLASQTHALQFYEALGFQAHGPEFLDAGISHRNMTLVL